LKVKIFSSGTLKNTLACYNAGVVVVNSETVGLAPGLRFFLITDFTTLIGRQIEKQQQGCQMIYFQTQNPNLGEFSRVL
jgi:hypothetical protein